ncbi:MAG: DUF3386 family protein [Planctomycetaceae bacterium]
MRTQPTPRFNLAAAGLAASAFLFAPPANAADKRVAKKPARLTAAQMMARAHKARAEWKGLPGFTADVAVSRDNKRVKGRVSVAAGGKLTLTLDDKAESKWVTSNLRSLISHRRASSGRSYDVEFADKETKHPLGRLIKLNEDLMGSEYRIRGDVITEVHRKMGGIRFTISVTAVARNKEGKYLPRSYSFSTWDVKTGNLKSNTTVLNTWKRVGTFDLPNRLLWVTTRDGGKREVRQIVFRNHRLGPAKTAAE